MKIITCTGYGATGSSAATDFFSEFDNVALVPHDFECSIIHEKDGLYDLEKAVEEGHRFKVDLAVKRFLKLAEMLQEGILGNYYQLKYKNYFNGKFLEYSKEFVEKTIGVKWEGWWHRIHECTPLDKKNRIFEIYARENFFDKNSRKKTKYEAYENDGWHPVYFSPETMYYENDIEKFRAEAKIYISKLMKELNPENKEFLLIDQLLPPIKPELYLHYFDDIKVIVVDRDPRDLYLGNHLFWSERYIPHSSLQTYLSFIKKQRNTIVENENVMRINFEDLVYNYENTSSALLKFTGLSEELHTKKKEIFIPLKSAENTRFFEKYSNFQDDIKIIESNLKEFLFDYSKTSEDFEIPKFEKKEVFPASEILKNADDIFLAKKINFRFVFWRLRKTVRCFLDLAKRK